MSNKTQIRTFMISRFREVKKKCKVLSVEIKEDYVDVNFEKDYTLRLNKAEAEHLALSPQNGSED